MTRDAKSICGVILLTVPTVQYGGYFLLTLLMDQKPGYLDNPLRQDFFRAGHAHAGVLLILSLVCEVLADYARLPKPMLTLSRLGVPAAAILLPLGFFVSMHSPSATHPNSAVGFLYAGAAVLAAAVITLGIGLIRGAHSPEKA